MKFLKLFLSNTEPVRNYQELVVGLPQENLTFLGLARRLATTIHREPVPVEPAAKAEWAGVERGKIKELVRFRPVSVKHPWAMANTKNRGIETKSYLFELSNGLNATGIWVKAIVTPDAAPATIVLDDQGKRAAAAEVSHLVNRGEQALAVDLLFYGRCFS